jgi:hypothetical protein
VVGCKAGRGRGFRVQPWILEPYRSLLNRECRFPLNFLDEEDQLVAHPSKASTNRISVGVGSTGGLKGPFGG